MKRDTLAAVLLALLAVVALGVAAATLDSAVSLGSGGFGGSGETPGTGDTADEEGVSPSPSGAASVSLPVVCYDVLREPPALLLFAGIVLLFAGIAYRDTGSLFAAAAVATAVGFPLGAVWWLLSLCRPLDGEFDFSIGTGGQDGGLLPEGAEGGSGIGGGEGAASAPEFVLVLVVLVALVASVAVLFAAGGDDEADSGEAAMAADDSDGGGPDLGVVGRTAGEAADRIEASSDADNQVYRAWRDMTEVLDVDRPASSTPAEFATAAVEAGVDEEPVTDLTAVFERVRYGGEDPTADRERRAVEALRRIEERYGSEGRHGTEGRHRAEGRHGAEERHGGDG